ncbi:MAG: DEAD/DEAH box helicase family protein [bacterium]|jgi:HKD family nuclease
MQLKQGLYEKVISLALDEGLKDLDPRDVMVEIEPIDQGEAQHVLSRYLAEVLQRGLIYIEEQYDKDEAIKQQIEVCNTIIKYLANKSNERELLDWRIGAKAQQLLAVFRKRNSIYALGDNKVIRPVTPLSQSSLFTGSAVEPSMVNELKKEIVTADRIDMLVSFIKWSGLRLILDELIEFTETRPLRVITTSYMGATDLKAIKELYHLPNTQVKVSYDTKVTRLHAKAYAFYRDTGFSTAYIGSSNLSNSAISSGLEWNIKVTERDMPHIIKNVTGTFEVYWNDYGFISYQEKDEPTLRKALQGEHSPDNTQFSFDIQPYQFQKEILEKLNAERKLHQRYRNLIVAATGTGKTVISAFDYKRFCRENSGKPNRLLFVAHRREILTQSLSCFRSILRDANFGELYDGLNQPTSIDHLFMTIQTFNSQSFHHLK